MSRSRPSTCVDGPASAREIAQEQDRIQQDHDEAAIFEATLAGVKNEGMTYDPFFGTSPADVRARRQSRGGYSQEDFQPPAPDPIDDYAGPRSGGEVRTWDDLLAHRDYRMALAREQHPDDWDEVIYDIVIPKLREEGLSETDPQVQQWLKNDGFAEALYEYGLELKHKPPKGYENWDGDSFGEWISANYGAARRPSEEEPPRPATQREQKRLGRIENLVDFAREFEAWKAKW